MARFDRIAHVYDWLPLPNHTQAIRECLSDAGHPRLDLGGGTGKYTVEMHGDAERTVVLDASRGMLEQARQSRRPLDLVEGIGQAMPFPHDAFAAATVTEAFHHFAPNQAAVVQELARVIQPDGVFVVEEIDPERLIGRVIELGENLLLRFGSRFRPPPEMAALFEEHFEQVRTRRTGSFTYLLEARRPRPA